MVIRKPLRRWHVSLAAFLIYWAVAHWVNSYSKTPIQWQAHVLREHQTGRIVGVREAGVKVNNAGIVVIGWLALGVCSLVGVGVWLVPEENQS